MRKVLLGIGVLVLATSLEASPLESYFNRVADAIYVAEGGIRTKFPYGIKSVRTNNPRRVCLVSVRNNWQRWQDAGCPGDFIDFMGQRYCPPQAHPLNRHWAKNVRRIYDRAARR